MNDAPSSFYEASPASLYSLLRRKLSTAIQAKAPPAQWIGLLRNMQRDGVSASEIEHSGLLTYLSALPTRQSVSRNEITAYLDSSRACEVVLQRLVANDYRPVVHFDRQTLPKNNSPVINRHKRREYRFLHYRERTFGFNIWKHVETDVGLFDRLQYWSLHVPHGRKHLPSFENGRRFTSLPSAINYARNLADRLTRRFRSKGMIGPTRPENLYDGYRLPQGENYTEWLITAPNLPVEYFGPHFDISNLVAHVRTTDRVDDNGRRLLVLEEIQSDWNQELREAIRQGLQDSPDCPPANPYLNHWLDMSLRLMSVLAISRNLDGIAWLPGFVHEERFPWANGKGLRVFYDQLVTSAADRLAKPWELVTSATRLTYTTNRLAVRHCRDAGGWQVIERATERIREGGFQSHAAALAYCSSQETVVDIPTRCLLWSDEMRRHVSSNGLPQLGAI